MNAENTLNKIMTYLGMENKPEEVNEEANVEVKFEQRKHQDGEVVFESDAFAAGDAVFILTEDGERIPAPEGHYAMEDGNVMMVNDQGVIVSYEEQPAAEEPAEEEAPAQEVEGGYDEEMQQEDEMAMPEEMMPEDDKMMKPKRMIQTESKSVEMQFESQISELKVQFEAEKAEWSKQLEEAKTQQVALQAEVDELKSKLAEEPAAQPLTHSVERGTERKEFFRAKQGKGSTLQNNVFRKINNK